MLFGILAQDLKNQSLTGLIFKLLRLIRWKLTSVINLDKCLSIFCIPILISSL